MLDIYHLTKGKGYVVRKSFTDFYKNRFVPGETLTFTERHFLPYDGGHTLMFRERNIYLQEEYQAEILDNLGDYLEEKR